MESFALGEFSRRYEVEDRDPGTRVYSSEAGSLFTTVAIDDGMLKVHVAMGPDEGWHAFRDGKMAEAVAAPAAWGEFEPSPRLVWDSDPAMRYRAYMKARYSHLPRANTSRTAGNGRSLIYEFPSETDDDGMEIGRAKLWIRDDATGEQIPVQPPTTLHVSVIGFITARGQFLIESFEEFRIRATTDPQPREREKPRRWLVDPANGALTEVSGDFAPLAWWHGQGLQSGPNPDQAWMATFNEQAQRTELLLYDFSKFTGRLMAIVPDVMFDTNTMYVDVPRRKLYFVTNGDLIEMPLKLPAEVLGSR
jgi:hypothetical protein